MPPSAEQPDSRAAAIARLIDDVRAARAAGREVANDNIIQAHPQLMPELGRELEKLRRIDAARRGATEASANRTVEAPPRPSRVPGYSILNELSRGGQGVVYVATQLSTGRKVAVKVLRDGPLADERKLARFQREVQVLAALNHPNIVTIIDTGQAADGSRYIVMNYIAGMDLGKYMLRRQQKDPDDPSKLLRMFLKICDAVNAAHQKGIVHRDLKPGNIRVDERGEPHVLDFGLARTALSQLAADEQPVSITGEFMGSLPWCSPEQAEGNPDKIDARTDVYSLGVILYQMLTGGQFPYAVAGNIRDVLNNILTAAPTPPSKVIAAAARKAQVDSLVPRIHPTAVNETIERIVLKALSKQRHERYQNAGEFKRDITNYLLGRQPQAPETEQAEPSLPPWIKKTLHLAKSLAVKAGSFVAQALEFLLPPRRVMQHWIKMWSRRAVILAILGFVAIMGYRHRTDIKTLWARVLQTDPTPAAQTVAIAPPGSSITAQPKLAPSTQLVAPAPTPSDLHKSPPVVLAPTAPRSIDLLKIVDPARDALAGDWQREPGSGALLCSPVEAARIEFPYVPPDEYDYIIRFVRTEGQRGMVLTGCASGHRYGWEVAGWGNSLCGFDRIDGRLANANETATPFSLPDAGPHVSKVKVRNGRIEGYVDNKLICKVETDFRNWDVPPEMALRRTDTLGFYGRLSGIRIESAQVVEVSGVGRMLSPAGPVISRSAEFAQQPGAIVAPFQPAPASTDRWTDLFNGRDLTGWKPAPGAQNVDWRVRDGMIVGTGTQGYLVTRRSNFQNYRLRVEARIAPGGNSGVFFHVVSPVPDRGGYQAQISDSTDPDPMKTGSLAYYSDVRGRGKRPVVLSTSPVAPNQWFEMEVICEGRKITIAVDGKQTASYVENDNIPLHGAIALEAFHTSPVQFRKVQIMELPASR